jgi:predicted ATP-binding protein involved in virulence
MQLKRLYIKDYKILKDFTIEFPYDFKKYISVFIGANGSGKSTILEAIAQIFSNVLNVEKSKFGFEIEYTLQNTNGEKSNQSSYYTFRLFSDDVAKPIHAFIFDDKVNIRYNSRVIKKGALRIDGKTISFLPDNIVIYYSGLSDIMQELCKPHEEKISDAYRKGNTDISREFFYYRPEHFGIILMSLLSFEYGDIPEFLKSKAKIEDIESFQILLKKPSWHKDSIESCWGAEGEVKKFLDFLKEQSLTDKNIRIKTSKGEKISVSLIGKNTLYKIREFLIEEKKLFEILNIMLVDGLLDEISFSLIKMTDGKRQVFNILSEGEQQAITIKGLTEFLSGKNTLFLFDEPDTYLHPEWQRQFIPEIQMTIKETINSENYYLIATHSPNIVSGIEKDSLFVLEHGEIKEIPFNSYGKNVESLLIDFFNVEGVRNKYVESLLMEVQDMVKNKQFESPDFKAKFQELKDILRPTAPEIVNINLEIAKSRKK